MIRIDSRVTLFVRDERTAQLFEDILDAGTGDGYVLLEFKGAPYEGTVVAVPEDEPEGTMKLVAEYFEGQE